MSDDDAVTLAILNAAGDVAYELPHVSVAGNEPGYKSATWQRTVRDVGTLTFQVPLTVPRGLFNDFQRVRVERWRGGRRSVENGTYYYVTARQRVSNGADAGRTIECMDLNMWAGAAVAAESTQDRTARAVTVIADVARAHLTSSSAYASVALRRNLGASLPAALARGPIVTVGIRHRALAEIFNEVCEQAHQQGTWMAWDFHAPDGNGIELRVGVDVLGKDRRQQVTLAEGAGVVTVTDREDVTESATRMFTAAGDVTAFTEDLPAFTRYQLPRHLEAFVSASTGAGSGAAIRAAAKRSLSERAAKDALEVVLASDQRFVLGVDYGFGDIINVATGERTIAARVDSVTSSIAGDGTRFDQIALTATGTRRDRAPLRTDPNTRAIWRLSDALRTVRGDVASWIARQV